MPVTSSDWVVVIPSNREVSRDRLNAIPPDVAVIVVEDGEVPVRCDRPGARILDMDFQRRYMGADFDLIPRETAACRNFGFYYVWRETGYSFVVTLDDDVETRDGFLESYSLLGSTVELPTVVGCGWVNPIALFDAGPPCFARGFPYEERDLAGFELVPTTARVVCHMGLWDGMLDTNALDKQLFESYRRRHEDLRVAAPATRVGNSADRVKYPVSSMNVGFVRELLPAMYQMPMHRRFAAEYGLWRYDDIWAGYVAQTLIGVRGEAATVGAPIVYHDKAGDLQRELRGEHYGMLMSQFMYEVIATAAADLRSASYAAMLADLSDRILTNGPSCGRHAKVPPLYWRYIEETSTRLQRWSTLCLS